MQATTRPVSRRQALAIGAGTLASGLAGCLDGVLGSGRVTSHDGPVAAVSFFSFYDFARQIAVDTPLLVKNLVPTGLHGHGWRPDASVIVDIATADAFVHVGEDFQPWADRAMKTIQDDGIDVTMINARADIELVDLAASLDRDEEGVGDRRGKDPHFWLDPQRAKQSVDNILAGFVELIPEHEETLRENATTYKREVLDRIDRDYEQLFANADRSVVQLAAHNAFQYLGVRYGVEMRPLVTNLAASGDIKLSDISDAKDVIEEHGIEYIGAGVFETRKPAKQLLAETPVTAYFPVTPYAGARDEWVADDWGYEEIADNINMPTFEVVVGNKSPEEAGPAGWADRWRNFD